MRVVCEIPHELFTITVFSWNGKYLLKFELDGYEQLYKIPESSVSGAEEIKKMVNGQFLDEVFEIFLKMRTNFTASLEQINN